VCCISFQIRGIAVAYLPEAIRAAGVRETIERETLEVAIKEKAASSTGDRIMRSQKP
jgi:hypothetical protein